MERRRSTACQEVPSAQVISSKNSENGDIRMLVPVIVVSAPGALEGVQYVDSSKKLSVGYSLSIKVIRFRPPKYVT